MTVAALVVAAILSLAPVGQGRAAELAAGIVDAAQGDLEAALLLVTVAGAESSFLRTVQTCAVTGDGGRAVTAYQLHRQHWGGHTRAEVCANHALASRLALGALGRDRAPRDALAAFLGRRLDDPEVERRVVTFERLVAEARAKGGDS